MGRVRKDMATGAVAEVRVVNVLCALGYAARLNDDKSQRWYYDIEVGSPPTFTLEVKHDIYAHRSGNIAIETFNPKSGKPSGLGVTQSTLWCHVIDKIYVGRTSDLRHHIETVPPKRLIAAGGDNNATLYLYEKDEIVASVFRELSECDLVAAKSVIEELLRGV
jgi:hypothetical protein